MMMTMTMDEGKNVSFLYLSKEHPNHVTEAQLVGVRSLYDASFPLRCRFGEEAFEIDPLIELEKKKKHARRRLFL